MTKAILGKKIGMTQVYSNDNVRIPVTVIEAGPCQVLQVKNKDSDGYFAVQLGFGDVKESSVNKPLLGHFKKANVTPKRFVRELRTIGDEGLKAGDKVELSFEEGTFVDVTGITKGKGFQGGMKRWGWAGGGGGHGSMFHRAPGSIQSGPRLTHVTKGHHMPGHMGCDTKTIQNLEIIKVDKENNILLIKGAVPGANNGFLFICEAKKRKGKKIIHPPSVSKKGGVKTASKLKEAKPKEAKKK